MSQLLNGAYAQAVELGKREGGVTPLELCEYRKKNPKGIGGFTLVCRYLHQEGWLTKGEDERAGHPIYFFAPSGHALVRARRRKRESERHEKRQEREEAFEKTLRRPKKVRKRDVREAKMLTPYQLFLKSEYWQEVRQLVLERDKHACVRCKATGSLQVHHRTYEHHGREKEYLNDLEAVCEICHKAGHGIL